MTSGSKRKEGGNKPAADKGTALSGIRVLELGAFQMAPLAARWLAESGAEVIKIEGLPAGDPSRGALMTARGRSADTRNWTYEYFNRNKKSVALKLEDNQAREILYRLVEKSDVFISNLREVTLRKTGVDYESLAKVNPRLVYAVGTGFGIKGPHATRPALDMIGQARSGVLGIMGDLETFTLLGNWTPCDKVAALQLAYGIMAALFVRERTGKGQRVDASLLGAGVYLAALELQYFAGTGEPSPVMNRKNVSNPLRNLYRTKDGRWLVFNMTQGDRYWPEFCKALGIEHVQHKPEFESLSARDKNRADVISFLEKVFAARTKAEWERALSRHDLIWSSVNSIAEAVGDVQVIENEYMVDGVRQQEAGVKMIGPLVGMDQTPLDIGGPAPELGQHTEEVLLEMGYTWDDLGRLKEAGVII